MRIAIKTNNGWLSLQPDGTLEYRPSDTTPGAYETFDFVNLDPPPPPFECKFVPGTGGTPVDPPVTTGNPILPNGAISRDTPVTILPEITWYPPSGTDYNCLKGVNFNDTYQTMNYCKHAQLIAYGKWTEDNLNYYFGKKAELIARGAELGQTPPELYYWERMIGRGCGVGSVALFGPYAGLVEYEGSLVS